MKFSVKKLQLFETLVFMQSSNDDAQDKKDHIESFIIDTDEKLYAYENGIDKKNTEPKLEEFLIKKEFLGYRCLDESFEIDENSIDKKKIATLDKGSYLFVQSIHKDEQNMLKAAEALYLEGLWQNLSFVGNRIYVRFLEEDGKTIFQLLRPIATALL